MRMEVNFFFSEEEGTASCGISFGAVTDLLAMVGQYNFWHKTDIVAMITDLNWATFDRKTVNRAMVTCQLFCPDESSFKDLLEYIAGRGTEIVTL